MDMPDHPLPPNLEHETRLWQMGFQHIAGIDEAGRGALAGPVAAGAVILPRCCEPTGVWRDVRDSKLLTPAARTELAAAIRAAALSWSVGMASAAEIDQMGIAPATRLAMQRAVAGLTPPPDYLLIDWVKLPGLNIRQESLTKADQRIVSVAAASILAKVTRDEHLAALDVRFPAYGFARHKGYGVPAHLAALAERGPCPIHRHSFAPIARRPSLFDAVQPERKPEQEAR
ncbi:MAG: ribonuclease HII [Caldilineaceae bacterium]|nr:ribonuclease HII [Caldilineaceae bacterium]